MKPNVIAVSYAKRALVAGTRERERMLEYARVCDQYHVIVFTRKKEGYQKYQTDGSLTLHATNAYTKIGMLWQAYKIGKKILKQNVTKSFVVSSQDPFETSVVGRLLVSRSRHVHQIQIHGDVFNPRSYKYALLQMMRVRFGQYVVRQAHMIRVVSERIKQSLLKMGVADNRIAVLPIQSDLESFFQIGKERFEKLAQHQKLHLLYVGRFSPEKNVILLLQAAKHLKERKVNFLLTLVGDGPDKKELEAYLHTHSLTGVVRMKSWSENIPHEMSQAEVFCLSSNHEGWAMVLQEAAAAGMAIVTTDVGCAGQLIKNEKTGLVVPVADLNKFIDAIERLQSAELRQRLGMSAYEACKANTLSKEEYMDTWVATHVVK